MTAPAGARPALAPPLTLDDLTLGYGGQATLHAGRLQIASGSLTAVVGPNGGGKSTLLKALAGALRPMGGRIHGLQGRRVAYLPQQSEIDRSFPIRVMDMVAMGLWHEIGAMGRLRGPQRDRCRHALEAVGLADSARHPIGTLSGGQFQRALFARLLLQDADVLLLDEPFAAIDSRTTDDLMVLLLQWHAAGKTILVVLHDLDLARHHCPQALMLAHRVVAHGPAERVITEANWMHGRRLPSPAADDMPAERPTTDSRACLRRATA